MAKIESSSPTQVAPQVVQTEPRGNGFVKNLFDSIPSIFDAEPSIKLEVGQIVVHKKFGKGRVVAFKDNNQQVQINFDHEGGKWLAVEIAKPSLTLL